MPTRYSPLFSRSVPKWSPEEARTYAAKSVQVRKANAIKRRELRENSPPPKRSQTSQESAIDGYADRMLTRVRKEINQIADRLGESVRADLIDAQKIDRLSAAWSKLAELERQYADRPLPGTKKPAEAKGRTSMLTQEANQAPTAAPAPPPASGVQEQE